MTLSGTFPYRLEAIRPEWGALKASVSAGDFDGPGSGGWEAQVFSLVSPADWQILDTNQLIGGQLGRLPSLYDGFDNVGDQVGDSKHASEIRRVDSIAGGSRPRSRKSCF